MLFGNVKARQTEVGQLAIRLARKAACLFNAAPAFKVVALVNPFANCVAELFLVVGKIEVHF